MLDRFIPRAYAGLLLISCCHFLFDFMMGIWPIYKTLAGIDLALAGIIYAVSASIGEGMQALFGNWSDRGWRKSLIIGGMSLSLGGALFAFTHEPIYLFLLFLFICIGSGAFHPAAVGLASSFTQTKKSLYVAHFSMFGLLGLGLSQIGFAAVYGKFDGNTLILAVPVIAIILFSLKKSQMQTPERKGPKPEHPKFKMFLKFFKNVHLRNLYFSQISNQTVAWGLIFLLPDILKTRGYEGWIVYGGGHLVYILGGVCLLLPSGFIADRFSSKSVICIATLLGGFFFYTFLFFPGLSDQATLLILFATGATISVVNPVSIAMGHKLVPHHPGMVSAFLMGCVWCVSEFVGPGMGGLLTKLFDEDAPARAMMMVGSLFILGFWASFRLPSEIPAETPAEVAEESLP